MDFPGDATTNFSAITGFSVIHWRIYTEEANTGNPSSDIAPNSGYNILRHLSRLKDLEIQLRNSDCLVSCYPRRLGLWIFSPTPGFESLSPLARDPAAQGLKESTKLIIGTSSLKVSAFGSITAVDLIRSLSTDGFTSVAGNPGHPARSIGAGVNAPRSGDAYANSMAIYASFITAMAGTIGLQLVKRHNAIPLGARTFYTAVERSFYDNPIISDANVESIPALTTLRIELTQAGKIVVALHTVRQDGISRLKEPGTVEISTANIQNNMDVWLAPNGTVARLITVNMAQSAVFAPKQAKSEGAARQITEAKQRVWKATVLEWLNNVGLPVDHPEDEHWVEVEVSEPFYARLAAEHLRQMDDSQSSSPLKRILWPSRYCFRRSKIASSSITEKIPQLAYDGEEPLHFAETWLETATSRHEKPKDNSSNIQKRSQNEAISGTIKFEVPEKIESLARVIHYPDLQNASSVYPTPPDGALAPGINPMHSDTLGPDGQDIGLSHTPAGETPMKQQENVRKASSDNPSFEHMNVMEVGTGLYDTNDDDELFSGMNDKDFGSKGITDADFSFFDDDDDDEMNDFLNDKPEPEPAQHDVLQPNPDDLIDVPVAQAEIQRDQLAPEDNVFEQDEMQQSNDVEASALSTVDTKQPSPTPPNATLREPALPPLEHIINAPLSPTDIKQMLFSNKDKTGQDERRRASASSNPGFEKKQSRYNAISFKRGLTLDQKYANAGRFFFTANKDNNENSGTIPGIPTIGFPSWRRSGHRGSVDEVNTSRQIGSEQHMQRTDSASSDESSLDSSDDDSEDETSPFRLATLKRKRPLSEAEKSTTSSMEKLSITSEVESHVSKEDTSIFLGNFFSVFTDWSLVGYFSAKQSQVSPVTSRKEDQMQVAQLMVDQLTQSSLSHKIEGWESDPELEYEALGLPTFLDDSTSLGENDRLDLKSYVTIHDIAQTTTETPSARPTPQRREVKGSITKIAPSHLRIHRGRDFLEVLSTSMPFWETFGLEPASGRKDVSAYCICPEFAKEEADAFMTRLGLLYSGCNLGKHVKGDMFETIDEGIGLWNIAKGDSSYARTMQALRGLCEDLASALSKAPQTGENFVIYIINPFSHGAAFVDICSSFLHLFHKYVGDVDKNQDKSQLNELVLQIVPLDFVFSPTSMVVPPQSQYLNLALEVYTRCPPKDSSHGIIGYAPPVVLADAVPKAINFRVTSEHFSPFQEGRCLHVAISRSVDQRWISVAWTNNSGSCQISMSYCVRARGSNVNRIISEVRQEIWEATKDLMERTQTRWKVLLVRTEPIDQEEIDAWTGFAERYNQAKALPVELIIFSANIAPGLRLEPSTTHFSVNTINPLTSTPVATPYGGVPSPDQLGAATPASGGQGPTTTNYNTAMTPTDTPPVLAEADSDAVLIDACEESWAVILSHRLNNSAYLTDYKPALVSGYLLRRKGVNDSQGVTAMSLNLVYTSRPPALHEAVLREALINYRDLSTLARAKGTLHVQHNTLPWHIATAVKGQELLSFVL
uniref:Mediator of RNA polymerase II transcription subunit 13 n=1 Tax=Talaromyces marneffei PM1 TaxID=1077442 RepID=A0A093VL25_TALMA